MGRKRSPWRNPRIVGHSGEKIQCRARSVRRRRSDITIARFVESGAKTTARQNAFQCALNKIFKRNGRTSRITGRVKWIHDFVSYCMGIVLIAIELSRVYRCTIDGFRLVGTDD
ncbi:hypothetical protein RGU70_00930 [Herbaspirillum sp. RTI4]|uniref:hypothetical protein n=1 Tax=Herbaspirillum sp. RTI4 TaxID=3048640 RepID=UPI002AB3E8BC|nr:hypothetical protein [Herbaspirillum sp. RTI4]MDY7576890.1 hypothetical protein [Herbaspirillum sp. RTI4]MEA9982503.1 hypothetical protein [Herbaspirillum sp. RTI4]